MTDFPSQVQVQPAVGIQGDFCDHNPRSTVDAGPGGLVAGASGLLAGLFAWATFPSDGDGAPAVCNNFGVGEPTGILHSNQQGLIQVYLEASSLKLPAGFQCSLFNSGGFFVKNVGSTPAQYGMKAFANINTGEISFAAAGTIPGGASGATSAIADTTLTLTGGISDNILTVTNVAAGSVYKGATLTSNGVGKVVKQITPLLSGEVANGVGRYLLSVNQQVVAAGTTIGGHYGVITFGTVTGGPFTVGMSLTGANILSRTNITDTITGGATSGTMVTDNYAAVSSSTIVGSSVVETKWYARSVGNNSGIVKMSSQPNG